MLSIQKNNGRYILQDGDYVIKGQFQVDNEECQKLLDSLDLTDGTLKKLLVKDDLTCSFMVDISFETLPEDNYVHLGLMSIYKDNNFHGRDLLTFKIDDINIGSIEEYKENNWLEQKLKEALNI